MQFYCVLRTPWPRRRPALLLLTSHVLATSTYVRTYVYMWADMDDDGEIETKGKG